MESPVAKKATRRWMRCVSAGVSRERRSTRSVEKSTSSTVQVFLMPFLNISKKTGYCMGLRVSERPGSRMDCGAFEDILGAPEMVDQRSGGRDQRSVFRWRAPRVRIQREIVRWVKIRDQFC